MLCLLILCPSHESNNIFFAAGFHCLKGSLKVDLKSDAIHTFKTNYEAVMVPYKHMKLKLNYTFRKKVSNCVTTVIIFIFSSIGGLVGVNQKLVCNKKKKMSLPLILQTEFTWHHECECLKHPHQSIWSHVGVSAEEWSPSFPPPRAADPWLTHRPVAGVLMFTLAKVAPSMFILWHKEKAPQKAAWPLHTDPQSPLETRLLGCKDPFLMPELCCYTGLC